MTKKIAVLPGDGIGTEIVEQAIKVLDFLNTDMNLGFEFENGLIAHLKYDEITQCRRDVLKSVLKILNETKEEYGINLEELCR
jgi:isocitrate/isopropylmalate dehydrogenase